MKIAPVIAALIVFFGVSAARADTAVDKLGRGVAGMTTGVLEIPGNIKEESERNGAGYGATVGVAKGVGMTIARELVGVYEFVTAPIPVPHGFRPVLEPEYPWDYFNDHRA
jgi:putative exosortase-associated protein (TIGR04073 family)